MLCSAHELNYQLHGIESLKAKTSKPVYAPEFKFNTVQILLNETYIHE